MKENNFLLPEMTKSRCFLSVFSNQNTVGLGVFCFVLFFLFELLWSFQRSWMKDRKTNQIGLLLLSKVGIFFSDKKKKKSFGVY